MPKMCMKFNFISKYAHIYMEYVLCIVAILTTLDPISLGTRMYLNVVFRYIKDAMDACLIHKEGVVTT